jgi:hypothetical protein
MLARDRLLEIERAFGKRVERIIPLELDGETLRLILYLKDGANLRVAEQWRGKTLERYSYYWLSAANDLKIGWDNAPHHIRLDNYPHHKHVGHQNNLQSSFETCLEKVMMIVLTWGDKKRHMHPHCSFAQIFVASQIIRAIFADRPMMSRYEHKSA